MSVSRRGFFKLAGGGAALLATAPLMGVAAKVARAAKKSEVEAYGFICGILKTQTQYLLKDTRVGTPFNIPVPFFVIRHGNDWVAFDTGNNAMVAKDPKAYWSEAVVKAYTPVMKPEEEFKIQIKKLGLTPKQFKCAVISHGHLDHAGAIDNFVGTDVPLYFQKAEMPVIKKAIASGKRTAYIPGDFKQISKLNVKVVDGVFDVFGDGTVVAFPTPGHSPGHQSLVVRLSDGQPLVLCADAMYTLENMFDVIPPGLAWDIPKSVQTLNTFTAMRALGASMVPSHDPAYWKYQVLAPKVFEG